MGDLSPSTTGLYVHSGCAFRVDGASRGNATHSLPQLALRLLKALRCAKLARWRTASSL